MIIIYNISGLLLGAAGAFFGLVVFVLTGWLSAGVLAVAAVWFLGGMAWKLVGVEPGQRRRFPALFFIPLPFAAVPIGLLAFPMMLFEAMARNRPVDPRDNLLSADERVLDSTLVGGDAVLSRAILDSLQEWTVEEAGADAYHVFTKRRGDAVLVLVKVPNLKKYEETARTQLLDAITEIVEADPESEGKRVYIGIKGKLTYGAIRLPTGEVKTGTAVDDDKLYAFYGEAEGAERRAVPRGGVAAGPATGARAAPSGPVLKVFVGADESLMIDGEPATSDELTARLDALKASGGSVWYSRENPADEATPGAMMVMQMIVDRKLPVRLSARRDFSDVVGPDGVSRSTFEIADADTPLMAGLEVSFLENGKWVPATIEGGVRSDSVEIRIQGAPGTVWVPRERIGVGTPPEGSEASGATDGGTAEESRAPESGTSDRREVGESVAPDAASSEEEAAPSADATTGAPEEGPKPPGLPAGGPASLPSEDRLGSAAPPSRDAALRVAVGEAGEILVDGEQASLDEVTSRLSEIRSSGGALWLYRAKRPQAMRVGSELMGKAREAGVPVRMALEEDFSDLERSARRGALARDQRDGIRRPAPSFEQDRARAPDAPSESGDRARLGKYAGPGSVPPTGRAVRPGTKLVEGMIVQGRWHSTWFPATILNVDGDKVKVEWNGWDQQETLTRDKIALAPPEVPQPEGAATEP